jgi:protein-disulfide isomerase
MARARIVSGLVACDDVAKEIMVHRKQFSGWVLNGTLGAVSLAALSMVAVRLRDAQAVGRVEKQLRPTVYADYRSLATGTRRGGNSSKVTIVWFSDFQCPFCKQAATAIHDLKTKLGDDITVVYRHYPLPNIHPKAVAAALAAICADRQGRLEEMEIALFAKQDSIGKRPFTAFAVDAHVPDSLSFLMCLDDPTARAVITRDSMAAASSQIAGTPLIFVNGWRFDGFFGATVLNEYVAKELRK